MEPSRRDLSSHDETGRSKLRRNSAIVFQRSVAGYRPLSQSLLALAAPTANLKGHNMQQVFYPGHALQPCLGEYAIVLDHS